MTKKISTEKQLKQHYTDAILNMTNKQIAENFMMIARSRNETTYNTPDKEVINLLEEVLNIKTKKGKPNVCEICKRFASRLFAKIT